MVRNWLSRVFGSAPAVEDAREAAERAMEAAPAAPALEDIPIFREPVVPSTVPAPAGAATAEVSALLAVQGVGQGTVDSLRSAGFGTLTAIMAASDAELMTVAGVGRTVLPRIRAFIAAGGAPEPRARTRRGSGERWRDLNPMNAARIADRATDELIGLAKGLLDRHCSEAEAEHLRRWCSANPEVAAMFPGAEIVSELQSIFADGVVRDAERVRLEDLLAQVVGRPASADGAGAGPTTLPLTDPAPPVVFAGKTFVFTGTFAYGPRNVCEEHTRRLGAGIRPAISQSIDYLVIGSNVTKAWAHSTHGRKIEEAVALRKGGCPIAIISEDHWVAALG